MIIKIMKQSFLSNEQLKRITELKKYAELISELFWFLKMLFAFSTPAAQATEQTVTNHSRHNEYRRANFNLFAQKQYYKLKNFNHYNIIIRFV